MTTPTRGNLVAVITNGTAVLGLGNLGALASKPVMEGQGRSSSSGFADVNSIDIELDTEDVDAFCQAGAGSWGRPSGASNLEDIKAPECFMIEQRLKEEMDYSRLPRRPAWHGGHLCGRPHQRGRCTSRQEDRGRADRAQRGRGGGHRLRRTPEIDGGKAAELHRLRYQGRALARAEPRA